MINTLPFALPKRSQNLMTDVGKDAFFGRLVGICRERLLTHVSLLETGPAPERKARTQLTTCTCSPVHASLVGFIATASFIIVE